MTEEVADVAGGGGLHSLVGGVDFDLFGDRADFEIDVTVVSYPIFLMRL